ncbi:putative piezo-type mechanosensitive ion channel component 1/2 [Blattamonas nauphoetae]|uniref:Piezo-type mechanosensitive ion channel component 1/2 n=1 Tax=Blattamonas nauphoetae TaxID=2049346 RepID=A0ABQ9XD67_9EUKA|nr:putative piezo-type mechanosensitive ion channel component 1/2 [Blattamonas nauphoetae]
MRNSVHLLLQSLDVRYPEGINTGTNYWLYCADRFYCTNVAPSIRKSLPFAFPFTPTNSTSLMSAMSIRYSTGGNLGMIIFTAILVALCVIVIVMNFITQKREKKVRKKLTTFKSFSELMSDQSSMSSSSTLSSFVASQPRWKTLILSSFSPIISIIQTILLNVVAIPTTSIVYLPLLFLSFLLSVFFICPALHAKDYAWVDDPDSTTFVQHPNHISLGGVCCALLVCRGSRMLIYSVTFQAGKLVISFALWIVGGYSFVHTGFRMAEEKLKLAADMDQSSAPTKWVPLKTELTAVDFRYKHKKHFLVSMLNHFFQPTGPKTRQRPFSVALSPVKLNRPQSIDGPSEIPQYLAPIDVLDRHGLFLHAVPLTSILILLHEATRWFTIVMTCIPLAKYATSPILLLSAIFTLSSLLSPLSAHPRRGRAWKTLHSIVLTLVIVSAYALNTHVFTYLQLQDHTFLLTKLFYILGLINVNPGAESTPTPIGMQVVYNPIMILLGHSFLRMIEKAYKKLLQYQTQRCPACHKNAAGDSFKNPYLSQLEGGDHSAQSALMAAAIIKVPSNEHCHHFDPFFSQCGSHLRIFSIIPFVLGHLARLALPFTLDLAFSNIGVGGIVYFICMLLYIVSTPQSFTNSKIYRSIPRIAIFNAFLCLVIAYILAVVRYFASYDFNVGHLGWTGSMISSFWHKFDQFALSGRYIGLGLSSTTGVDIPRSSEVLGSHVAVLIVSCLVIRTNVVFAVVDEHQPTLLNELIRNAHSRKLKYSLKQSFPFVVLPPKQPINQKSATAAENQEPPSSFHVKTRPDFLRLRDGAQLFAPIYGLICEFFSFYSIELNAAMLLLCSYTLSSITFVNLIFFVVMALMSMRSSLHLPKKLARFWGFYTFILFIEILLLICSSLYSAFVNTFCLITTSSVCPQLDKVLKILTGLFGSHDGQSLMVATIPVLFSIWSPKLQYKADIHEVPNDPNDLKSSEDEEEMMEFANLGQFAQNLTAVADTQPTSITPPSEPIPSLNPQQNLSEPANFKAFYGSCGQKKLDVFSDWDLPPLSEFMKLLQKYDQDTPDDEEVDLQQDLLLSSSVMPSLASTPSQQVSSVGEQAGEERAQVGGGEQRVTDVIDEVDETAEQENSSSSSSQNHNFEQPVVRRPKNRSLLDSNNDESSDSDAADSELASVSSTDPLLPQHDQTNVSFDLPNMEDPVSRPYTLSDIHRDDFHIFGIPTFSTSSYVFVRFILPLILVIVLLWMTFGLVTSLIYGLIWFIIALGDRVLLRTTIFKILVVIAVVAFAVPPIFLAVISILQLYNLKTTLVANVGFIVFSLIGSPFTWSVQANPLSVNFGLALSQFFFIFLILMYSRTVHRIPSTAMGKMIVDRREEGLIGKWSVISLFRDRVVKRKREEAIFVNETKALDDLLFVKGDEDLIEEQEEYEIQMQALADSLLEQQVSDLQNSVVLEQDRISRRTRQSQQSSSTRNSQNGKETKEHRKQRLKEMDDLAESVWLQSEDELKAMMDKTVVGEFVRKMVVISNKQNEDIILALNQKMVDRELREEDEFIENEYVIPQRLSKTREFREVLKRGFQYMITEHKREVVLPFGEEEGEEEERKDAAEEHAEGGEPLGSAQSSHPSPLLHTTTLRNEEFSLSSSEDASIPHDTPRHASPAPIFFRIGLVNPEFLEMGYDPPVEITSFQSLPSHAHIEDGLVVSVFDSVVNFLSNCLWFLLAFKEWLFIIPLVSIHGPNGFLLFPFIVVYLILYSTSAKHPVSWIWVLCSVVASVSAYVSVIINLIVFGLGGVGTVWNVYKSFLSTFFFLFIHSLLMDTTGLSSIGFVTAFKAIFKDEWASALMDRLEKKWERMRGTLPDQFAVRPFVSIVLSKEKDGASFHVLKLFVEIISLVHIIIQPNCFVPISLVRHTRSFSDLLSTGFTGPVVILILVHLVKLLVERACYVPGYMKARVVFFLIETIGMGIFFFAYSMFGYNTPLEKPTVSFSFYFTLQFLSCFVTACQISEGYPHTSTSHVLTPPHKTDMVRMYLSKFTNLIPFLNELCLIVDWTMQKTALSLNKFARLEDIYGHLWKKEAEHDKDEWFRYWKIRRAFHARLRKRGKNMRRIYKRMRKELKIKISNGEATEDDLVELSEKFVSGELETEVFLKEMDEMEELNVRLSQDGSTTIIPRDLLSLQSSQQASPKLNTQSNVTLIHQPVLVSSPAITVPSSSPIITAPHAASPAGTAPAIVQSQAVPKRTLYIRPTSAFTMEQRDALNKKFHSQSSTAGIVFPVIGRVLEGALLIVGIVFLIWGPLLLFSDFGVGTQQDGIIDSTLSISCIGVPPLLTSTQSNINHLKTGEVGALPISQLSLSSNERDHTYKTTFPQASTEYFGVTDDALSELLKRLADPEKEVWIRFDLGIRRAKSAPSSTIDHSMKFTLTAAEKTKMWNMMSLSAVGETLSFNIPQSFYIETNNDIIPLYTLHNETTMNNTLSLIFQHDPIKGYFFAFSSIPEFYFIAPPTPMRDIGAAGLVGFYTTYVIVISKTELKPRLSGFVSGMLIGGITHLHTLFLLAGSAFLKRKEGNLKEEEITFRILVQIIRNPSYLLAMTQPARPREFERDLLRVKRWRTKKLKEK